MKKLRFFLVLAFVMSMVFIAASCTSFQVSGLEVARTPTSGAVVGELDLDVKVVKFLSTTGGGISLFNLFAEETTDPLIIDAIRDEVARMGGSRAVNVTITYSTTTVDTILGLLTGGIYSPAYARITGTVLR